MDRFITKREQLVILIKLYFGLFVVYAEEAGHTRLLTVSLAKVCTILEEAEIKPNKITYYCENRGPDFKTKMHNVLLATSIPPLIYFVTVLVTVAMQTPLKFALC